MEVTLSSRQMDELAYKTAVVLAKLLKSEQEPEMVSTKEAAKILGIGTTRMRQIADRYPHIKRGDSPQAPLLFVRSALLR